MREYLSPLRAISHQLSNEGKCAEKKSCLSCWSEVVVPHINNDSCSVLLNNNKATLPKKNSQKIATT